MWRYAVDCQLIQNYTGSSVGQRNQKLLPHSTTTCALSLNQIILCPKKALKRNFSQVSFNESFGASVWQSVNDTPSKLCPVFPQTKMSARRKMAAVSMSVSIRLGATAANAGVALYYMRISMTVKKVPVFNPYYSILLTADKHLFAMFVLSIKYLIHTFHTLQLAVITLSIVWVAPLPAPTGQINTQARRHAPGHSPLLQATASKLWVPPSCSIHNFTCQVFIHKGIVV